MGCAAARTAAQSALLSARLLRTGCLHKTTETCKALVRWVADKQVHKACGAELCCREQDACTPGWGSCRAYVRCTACTACTATNSSIQWVRLRAARTIPPMAGPKAWQARWQASPVASNPGSRQSTAGKPGSKQASARTVVGHHPHRHAVERAKPCDQRAAVLRGTRKRARTVICTCAYKGCARCSPHLHFQLMKARATNTTPPALLCPLWSSPPALPRIVWSINCRAFNT